MRCDGSLLYLAGPHRAGVADAQLQEEPTDIAESTCWCIPRRIMQFQHHTRLGYTEFAKCSGFVCDHRSRLVAAA